MDTLMHPAKVLEHLSNVLTVDEWREFTQTEDYLWMCARADGYQGSAMDELVKRGTRRREAAWAVALDVARSVVAQEMEAAGCSIPSEHVRKAEEILAEKLMVEQDITPPTFKFWADCCQCGRVPVPEKSDEILACCPWCLK